MKLFTRTIAALFVVAGFAGTIILHQPLVILGIFAAMFILNLGE